jgi:hypothetical protein
VVVLVLDLVSLLVYIPSFWNKLRESGLVDAVVESSLVVHKLLATLKRILLKNKYFAETIKRSNHYSYEEVTAVSKLHLIVLNQFSSFVQLTPPLVARPVVCTLVQGLFHYGTTGQNLAFNSLINLTEIHDMPFLRELLTEMRL